MQELTTEQKAQRYDELVALDGCLAKVKPGEPIFTFRAQDKLASVFVRAWANQAAAFGCPEEKTKNAHDIAVAMNAWSNRKYPD